MTDARRAELVAIAEAATPGPRRFVKRVQVRPRSRRYRLDKREDEEVMFGSTNGAVVVCPSVEGTGGIHVAADERFAVECDRATVLALLREAEQCDALRELLWTLYEGLYGHRQAEGIDPFATAVGGALEVRKAFRQAFDVTMPQLRHEVAAAEARVLELQRHVAEWSARASQAERERDAARGDIAALTDAVNGWCREVGASESVSERMADVREAMNRVGYQSNGWRQERDAARAEATRLHKLVDLAYNCIDPDEHPEWVRQAGDAMVKCDETIDALKDENAHLRTRVAAAERLAEAGEQLARAIHAMEDSGVRLHADGACALAAWDAA